MLLIDEQCLFLHFPFLMKSSRVIYLEKNLWFITITNTTSSFYNFN